MTSTRCHDIDDVRAFCAAILWRETRRTGLRFNGGDYSFDDGVSDLVADTLTFAYSYDRTRSPSFARYAGYRLSRHSVPNIARRLYGGRR